MGIALVHSAEERVASCEVLGVWILFRLVRKTDLTCRINHFLKNLVKNMFQ